ncbi:MAG: X-Pro aminopeptidase [Alphaproteobacteria bacterium 64-11]|nr:aminopeptidase P family protein [Alphaproteobacteria bacterium]OJU08961.1 MAG: X-Pro aminopeptidase [Alphaproteobacteria bacterium 64-11]
MDKPFQSYDDQSDAATCAPRLAALRTELKARGLDGFVVPHSDEHMGEYLPPRAERLAWLTAFTGSAGAAVVLMDKAAVFVDGRYTLQVRAQTDTSLLEPRDLVAEGPQGWIPGNLSKGAKLGYDPWLHTQHGVMHLKAAAERAGGTLVACDTNPVDAVWKDQPAPPVSPAMPHALNLAGVKSEAKRLDLADGLKKAGAEAAVITLADSVCWLLNIRGHDVPHTPFTLAFAILHDDGSADLFLDPAKRTPELMAHLGNAVQLHAPGEFVAALDAMKGKTVLADPSTAAAAIFDRLRSAGAVIKPAADPCQLPKACKNPLEIEGMRKAHIRDGVAMARFLAWLETNAATGELTEIEAAEALEGFRRATGCLSDVSFDTISGAGSNGAIVHYRVTRKTNRVIGLNEMFLVDSGAQYPDGTTDVTRTVMVGNATPEMRDRFTRVLKGHIALATARFPDGTIGMQLDSFARRPLWEVGLDYDHGTGHGVGSYLSVHEGPQNISKKPVLQPLKPGMICSNEPGFYKAGAFGIRIENLIVVQEPESLPGGDRPMMGFETITLVPIDPRLIEVSLLTSAERQWVNDYHARVRETIGPLLDGETRAWLERATKPL